MPVDPVTRAQFRLALYRIEKDWYGLASEIEEARDRKVANRARKILRESIMASAEVFRAKPYFLSDEYSLVDCTIAPILWRLPHYEIDLSAAEAQPIARYAESLFERRSFLQSLTELEEELRG
jgi:RNA polymerase-associated protein